MTVLDVYLDRLTAAPAGPEPAQSETVRAAWRGTLGVGSPLSTVLALIAAHLANGVVAGQLGVHRVWGY